MLRNVRKSSLQLGALVLVPAMVALLALALLPAHSAHAAPSYSVYVGYADQLRAGPNLPSPWKGSPGVSFIGATSAGFDAGAIRIDNTDPVNPLLINDVQVIVLPELTPFDLWGSQVIPPGGTLILTQTADYNFDTSDFSPLPCGVNDGAIPQITITAGGVPTGYTDTGQVLNTGGYDLACQRNESIPWSLIGAPPAPLIDVNTAQCTFAAHNGATLTGTAYKSISLTLSDTDAAASLGYDLDSGAQTASGLPNPTTASFGPPTTGDGNHNLAVTASDHGQTSTPHNFAFTLDNGAPSFSFTRIAGGVQVTTNDAASGLAEIWFTGTNLDYASASPAPGETDGTTYAGYFNVPAGSSFTVLKANPALGASITVTATNQACTSFDPGFTIHGKGLHGHKSANRKSIVVDVDANS